MINEWMDGWLAPATPTMPFDSVSINKLTYVSSPRNLSIIYNINSFGNLIESLERLAYKWTPGTQSTCNMDPGCPGENLDDCVAWEGNAFC